MNTALADYQSSFIDFLLRSSALTFGDFVTKSGRATPYFINTGRFNSGDKLQQLGTFYAAHIVQQQLDPTVIFGPAYKGIPLAIATTLALNQEYHRSIGYSFDRKELKDHGDKGKIVGHQISEGDRIIIVEDVITAGTTMREVVPLLRSLAKVEIIGAVISVDRRERGSGARSAVQEVEEDLKLPVFPIVTINDIVHYLSGQNSSGFRLNAEMTERVTAYLSEYGA